MNNLIIAAILTVSASFAFAGGQDGNGGDLYVNQELTQDAIEEATLSSHAAIGFLLNSIESAYIRQEGYLYPQYKKLFTDPDALFRILDEVTVRFESNKACLVNTANGVVEEDAAAIIEDSKKIICISLMRIQSKLVRDLDNSESELFQAYIAALVLHELSHFFGTTEPEARALQKVSYKWFRPAFSAVHDRDAGLVTHLKRWQLSMKSFVRHPVDTAKKFLADLAQAMKDPNYEYVRRWVKDYQFSVRRYFTGLDLVGFTAEGLGVSAFGNLSREKDQETFAQIPMIAYLIDDFLNSRSRMELGFEGATSIEAYRYYQKAHNPAGYQKELYDKYFARIYPYSTIWLKKPQTYQDVQKLVLLINKAVDDVHQLIETQFELRFKKSK